MIEIVTLFLGLVTGPQPVALAVRPGDRALDRFDAATSELRRALATQHLVVLAGERLPHQIELSPAARGIRLAGLTSGQAQEGPR